MQTWALEYRVTGDATWVESNKGPFEIKVTRFAEVSGTGESQQVLSYSVVSAEAPAQITKGTYENIVVKVSSDVTRVRIVNGTKSSTYLSTTTNCTTVDNGDGTTTWTIRYRFALAGDITYGVQVRGNAWSESTNFDVTVA